MGKGEAVSMESMLKICRALDCDISDVMVLEKDADGKEERL
jgi:DNA-binding Xre family transcriptional regulator